MPVSMSMMPGTPIPAPRNAPGAAVLLGQAVNGVTHFADDVIAARGALGAEGDLLKKLAVGSDGRDAQVGAAEIDSDGEIRHKAESTRKALLIGDC